MLYLGYLTHSTGTTAMNSTLLLLNALALAVLAGFHFQSEPVAAQQSVEVASTYAKPHKPLPQLAVMTRASSVAAAKRNATPSDSSQNDHWAF